MSEGNKDLAPINKRGPKTLILDIETAPLTAYVWRVWKENVGVSQIKNDWFILCWAAKWINEDRIFYDALPRYEKHYKKNPEDDTKILEDLWKLINMADVVVAHNAKKFDVPKINSRFLMTGYNPPSPYKILDTLILAKAVFGFSTNKLAYLARFLKVGDKMTDHNFSLWEGCLRGDEESWKYMIEYNLNDTVILEEIYKKLRPWSKRHPNYGLYVDDTVPVPRCPACGSSNLKYDGNAYTTVGKFKRYECKDCHKSSRGRKSILTKLEKDALITNVM